MGFQWAFDGRTIGALLACFGSSIGEGRRLALGGALLVDDNVEEKIEIDLFALLSSDFLKEEPPPARGLLVRAFIYFLLFSRFFGEEKFTIRIKIFV